ncbi:hypothetical protein D9757_008226 [Collybiopsis confluens]|uniref:cAMP-independent regulatory protein pac2 n=1 Tax=Collybiopsis confluens TaxID=2823264 RepID=A0A8H5M4C1_9AGAR|nr:hypothetical protein D9757_008226 [Collybiopsis confluens]
MPRMQQPTSKSIRIRSTADAHKIFYAVQQGILKMVTRRLDSDERLALGSGCVYAWEGLGIERFTEGRRWSPSRVRDEFLFYYEKYSPPESSYGLPHFISELMAYHVQHSGSDKAQTAPRDWDPLVKQTYSVWVETDKGRRKWHLTAYFTQLTVDHLRTIDDIPEVAELVVPEGMFKSTRVTKSRTKADEASRASTDPTSREATASTNRTYAPFTPYSPSIPPQNNSSNSIPMYEPYPSPLPRLPEQSYAGTSPPRNVPLPTRTPYQNGNRVVPQPEYADTRYSPSPRIASGLTTPVSPYIVPANFSPSQSYSPAPSHSNGNGNAVYTPHLSSSHSQSPQQGWFQPTYQPTEVYLAQSSLHAPSPVRPPESPLAYSLQQQQQHFSLTGHYPHADSTSLIMLQQPMAVDLSDVDPTSYLGAASMYIPRPENGTASYGDVLTFSPGPLELDRVPSPTGSSASSAHSGEIGRQRDLAPLHSLKRHHPYRRDPEDDKTLRLLVPSAP